MKILILLLICFLFIGCDSPVNHVIPGISSKEPSSDAIEHHTENEEKAYESCEQVFVLNRLPIDTRASEEWRSVDGDFVEIKSCYGDPADAASRRVIRLYDIDGNLQKESEYGTTEPWYTENGVDLYTDAEFSSDGTSLVYRLVDAEGHIIKESEPIASVSQTEIRSISVYTLNERYMALFLNGGGTFCFLDRDMKICGIHSYKAWNYNEIIALSDHEILIVTYMNHSTFYYDFETDTFREEVRYENTPAALRAETIFYTVDAVYLIYQDGIYIQRDGTDTLLYSFEKSFYEYSEFLFIGVLPENRFLVDFTDAFTGETYPAILMATEEETRPMRKEIKVASIGYSRDGYTITHTVRDSIGYFNRNNDDYFITLTDYDALGSYDSDGKPLVNEEQDANLKTVFERDLLSGVWHDVYFIGEWYDITESKLSEKGLFADLSALAEEVELLDCVRASIEQNGEITAIPYQISMSSLLCTTDTLAPDEAFTYDRLFSVYASLDAGESMFFDNWVYETLTDLALGDFVDMETKVCHYDDPMFEEILTFSLNYQKDIRLDNGLVNLSCSTPIVTNLFGFLSSETKSISMRDDLFTPLSEGTVKFLKMDITTPYVLPLLYYMEHMVQKPINLCGYPTKDGGSLYMKPELQMAVHHDSENMEGAMTYLRMMLSDAVQTKVAETDFPVVKSVVEKILIPGYHYYTPLNDFNGDTGKSGVSYTFNGASEHPWLPSAFYDPMVQLHVTKEQQDALFDDICSSTMRAAGDARIRGIMEEELSAAMEGARSVADAAKIIQSRVFIYINE